MNATWWSRAASLALAISAVLVALALPSPSHPTAPTVNVGPLRLGQAWPDVKTVTFSALLPDGSDFEPLLIVDAATWVGIAVSTTAAGAVKNQLVVRTANSVRVVRTYAGQIIPTVVGAYVVAGQLYWLETELDFAGRGSTSVWQSALSGGPVREIAHDHSSALFFDSDFDLVLHAGRLYWAATAPANSSEIRSVPLSGGPETIRSFDRLYALTTWPWATSSADAQPGPVQLVNVDTGETRSVGALPSETLNCTPLWCRITRLTDDATNLTYAVEHPDGSARRRLSASMTPLNNDVGLLGRFEVTASPVSAKGSLNVRLWLHDLTTNQDVLLADVATGNLDSRRGYLWWSTGDNEVRVWHLVDLHQLR